MLKDVHLAKGVLKEFREEGVNENFGSYVAQVAKHLVTLPSCLTDGAR